MNTKSELQGHHHGAHHNRPDLIGEYKWGDLGQVILLILFLSAWALDSFVFKSTTFLSGSVAWYVRFPLAAILFGLSFYLSRSGLKIVFGEKREQPEVISKGVFSIVRHPIYLGVILFYLGMIMTSLSLLSFVLWTLIIVFYFLISRYEERLLLKHFGKDYEDYMKKVPMLLPF